MFRRILIPVLIFIALIAIAGGASYWIYNGYEYYQTDDAQVSGQVINVSAPVAGTLTTLTATVGEHVNAGDVLGTITLPSTGSTSHTSTMNVTSPMNGTLVQVPAVQGQNVATGLQLATLTDLNTISITAYVDESAINNVNVNQAVDIHIDAYSDTSFTGHVSQIVQATAGQFSLLPDEDPSSGNFSKVSQRIPVLITLDTKNGKDVVPGMSAEVTIHLH
ncbi:MAG TPA: efflux RND transporter periplasmic adaptor subunit [Ktedonobacteraceae bacterium]|jgi:multidrug resistance efflux pump